MDHKERDIDIVEQDINSLDIKDDIITQEDPMFHYFNELNHVRRDFTFPTFVNRTDEKEQTEKLITSFLEKYLSRSLNNCTILDLGTGEGDLSVRAGKYLIGKCGNLNYTGVDRSKQFVKTTTEKLISNNIKNNKIIEGDCFNNHILDKLSTKSTFLLASQVAFYAPSIIEFVDTILYRFDKVAFIITQMDKSFLNRMSIEYSIDKKFNTETAIKNTLIKHKEVIYENVHYPALIRFPTIEIKDLYRIAATSYNEITNSDEKEARNILEFIAGNTMECLNYLGKLELFIKKVEEHLKRNSNEIIFWNNLDLIVPTNHTTKSKLHNFWQELEQA